MLLREVDRQLGLTASLAECIADPRDPARIRHDLRTLLAQRVFGIALGYEDLNDHAPLRDDPLFAILAERRADSEAPLGSPSTLCRFENAITRGSLSRMSEVFVEQFIASFKRPPKELTVDFDPTDDRVHGKQEGRFFHGYYDSYCFLPLYVFCGDHLLCAYLRPSNIDAAMHSRAMLGASLLAETLDLSGRRQLFDAGGGPGTYSIFLVKRYPGLQAIVFDLPQTIEIAREIIADFGVAESVTTRAGDYFKDDFDQGNDVVFLSAILHSMGPEQNQSLLLKACDSLISGGLVVVHENLISDDGTSPLRAVLFSLNMLVNTGEGQSYSGTEIMNLMKAVGFVKPRVIPIPQSMGASLVISVKP